MDDMSGEQSTRLGRLEADINDCKNRLTSLEKEFQSAKTERSQMQLQMTDQTQKLDRILIWVDGANKVAGVATRHWKTALKFGCGVVTAWGITNPQVAHVIEFIGKFFGL